jgi:hypothetical protein
VIVILIYNRHTLVDFISLIVHINIDLGPSSTLSHEQRTPTRREFRRGGNVR